MRVPQSAGCWLAAACLFCVGSAHAERIRSAVPGASLNYLPIYSADAKGFFRDEGLENETISIGGPGAIAALMSGDVDFSGAGGSGLRAAVKGAPLKAILYQTEKPTWYLVAHPSIAQVSDLKGKRAGVQLIGDTEDKFMTMFIERNGLSAKDLTRTSVGTSPSDKILALKTGAVSVVILDPGGAVVAEREGLRRLAFLGDVFPVPFQGYVTTERKLAEHSAQVKRWLRAMVRSLLFVRDRPDEAAEIGIKKLPLGRITKPMLVEAVKGWARALPPGIPGQPGAEGIKNVLEFEIRQPLKMDDIPPAEKLLDFRLIAEVRKEFEQKGR